MVHCASYSVSQLDLGEASMVLEGGPVWEDCKHAGPAHTLCALPEMPKTGSSCHILRQLGYVPCRQVSRNGAEWRPPWVL